MTLHALNYNVTFRGGRSRATPVEGTTVRLPLADGLGVSGVRIYDPDCDTVEEPAYKQDCGKLTLRLPSMRIYKLIEIDGS